MTREPSGDCVVWLAVCPADALAIQGVVAWVVVNAAIGTFQEGRAEHTVAALQVRALREGAEQVLEAAAARAPPGWMG